MKINKRISAIPPSGIREFFDLVIGMKDIISLGVGEPDFATPWHITESAIHSLEQGLTSYTSNKGLKALRRAITQFLLRTYGLRYDAEEEILVTVGVSEAMDLAVRVLVSPGDKVLIPDPCFVSYAPLITLAGGKPVSLITEAAGGFKITPQHIAAQCEEKTKFLILNYPSNPTGASYTKKELTAIQKVCRQKGLTVLSDEVYDQLSYDFDHVPFAALPGAKANTLYFNGFSKNYAMTGWRIGFVCGPKDVVAAMTKVHQYTIMSAPTMGQVAALEAIKNGKKSALAMKKEYNRRRHFVVKRLNEIELTCHMPQGAFYAYPSIVASGMDSVSFAKGLLQSEKVAVVPGVAFSAQGTDFIRISYASSFDNLKEAFIRMERFLKKHS